MIFPFAELLAQIIGVGVVIDDSLLLEKKLMIVRFQREMQKTIGKL